MSTETLTEWLLRQVADDEEVAQEQLDAEAKWEAATRGLVGAVVPTPMCMRPERLLAECEAKRRIVERVTRAIREAVEETDQQHGWVLDGVMEAMLATARDLALPYADRPGYLAEWRP